MNLTFKNDLEAQLWQSFLCAALSAGIDGITAVQNADAALEAFRNRLPRVATPGLVS